MLVSLIRLHLRLAEATDRAIDSLAVARIDHVLDRLAADDTARHHVE